MCEETVDGQTQTYAWITNKRLSAANVVRVATEAGRVRFKIENQGFNIQKNSGLNLEHAYSLGQDTLKCYYYLLQIAHLFLQMLEMGSLLQHLARRYGSTPSGPVRQPQKHRPVPFGLRSGSSNWVPTLLIRPKLSRSGFFATRRKSQCSCLAPPGRLPSICANPPVPTVEDFASPKTKRHPTGRPSGCSE